MTKVQSKDIDNKAFLTTGTAPAFEVAIPREAAYADMDRQKITINLHASASAAITINVNWLGAKALVDNTGAAITSATADDYLDLIYDLSQDSFIGSAVGVSSENTSVGTTTSVVLWEDVLAGDGIGAVFYGNQTSNNASGWTTTLSFWDVDINTSAGFNIELTNWILKSLEFDIAVVWSPTDDILVRISWIGNVNKTLTIPFADLSSTIDLGLLYHSTYGEYMIWDNIAIDLRRDGILDVVNYYSVTTDSVISSSYTIIDMSRTAGDSAEADFDVIIIDDDWAKDCHQYDFELTSASTAGTFRLYLNDVLIYTSTLIWSWSWVVSVSLYNLWVLTNWDKLRRTARVSSWNPSTTYYVKNQVMHTREYLINSILLDWLDNNKVFKSDSRFKQTNKCDWIITTSGLEWEARDMQINGSLLQTIANVWNDYWLNNINISTAWSFSILQPAIDTPFLVWKWNTATIIGLMLKQTNWATDRALGKQELSNITQWFHDTTGTAIRPSTSGNIVEEIKTAGLFYFKMMSQTSGTGKFTANINWQKFTAWWTNGTKTQFFSVRVPAGTLTIAVWTNKGTSSGSSGLVEITPLYNIVLG